MLSCTAEVLSILRAQADLLAPEECCGLLLGRTNEISQVVPAPNVADDPLLHFEIDPAVLISAHRAARGGGPAVLGYYHSHPTGHPVPSATDCEHAGGDGSFWAIVAAGDVTFWRDGAAGFEALSYRIVAG